MSLSINVCLPLKQNVPGSSCGGNLLTVLSHLFEQYLSIKREIRRLLRYYLNSHSGLFGFGGKNWNSFH